MSSVTALERGIFRFFFRLKVTKLLGLELQVLRTRLISAVTTSCSAYFGGREVGSVGTKKSLTSNSREPDDSSESGEQQQTRLASYWIFAV
jgi:hypothetical protein